MNNQNTTQKNVSIREVLSEGWARLKKNLISALLVFLAAFVLESLATTLMISLAKHGGAPFIVMVVIRWILGIMLSIGTVFVALKLSLDQKAELRDLFAKPEVFFNWVIATILYGFVVLFGLFMFVVPGLILAVRLGLFPYYIVGQNAGPIEALEKSWQTVHGVSWKVLGFNLLSGLINIAGGLCLLVGLFITIPLTIIAKACLFRKLKTQTFPPDVIEVQAEIVQV